MSTKDLTRTPTPADVAAVLAALRAENARRTEALKAHQHQRHDREGASQLKDQDLIFCHRRHSSRIRRRHMRSIHSPPT